MSDSATRYFPRPESEGGWRTLSDPAGIRALGGVDSKLLTSAWEYNLRSKPHVKTPDEQALNPRDTRIEPEARSSAVVVIRHGFIVGEWYQAASPDTRWNIHSCTKSMAGTAFGILFEESSKEPLPRGQRITLDSPAYAFIPEGRPLTDPRKSRITVRHLLSMSSGIKGEGAGIFGVAGTPRGGPFEVALGQSPTAAGSSTAYLAAEPGTIWDYSDPAFAHLSLIFVSASGMELSDFMDERVFQAIGLRGYEWQSFGGEAGQIGPHTIPNGSMRTNARDLARFGYLHLAMGSWEGRQIVPREWIERATRSSQNLNRSYGLTWWVNTTGTLWPAFPRDAFAAMGYLGNKCYVIPSLDMVIVRVADGPWPWDEAPFLARVREAVL